MSDNKICFVISPIGEDGSETRERSDQILKYIVTPVAEACRYRPIRADQISEPGMITAQVIQYIVEDPMVIADLTDWNPNVFYELALRHALRKPTVHLSQAGQKIPFDVAGTRTIQVDHQSLPSVEACKTELAQQIRAVESNPSLVDNPISVSVELQALRQSDNPLEQSNAQIMGMLQEVLSILGTRESGVIATPVLDALNAAMSVRELLTEVIDSQSEAGITKLSEARQILTANVLGPLHSLRRRYGLRLRPAGIKDIYDVAPLSVRGLQPVIDPEEDA